MTNADFTPDDLSPPDLTSHNLSDPTPVQPVLTVEQLAVYFSTETATGKEVIKAVDNISFELLPGQTLGLVGESGSGKSVTALSLMRLVPEPGKIVSGRILFRANDTSQPIDLLQLPEAEMPSYRGGVISMVFQEPMSSLNPVYTIGFQLTEALRQHENLSPTAARRQAIALLQEVKVIPNDEQLRARYQAELTAEALKTKIPVPEVKTQDSVVQAYINEQKREFLERYPHQLSGGQIQRVMIAMAISCNPTLLIADEPTTALDVTVQAAILDLLHELQSRRQMAIIFVTHDLGIISEIADTVAVMYRGKIVETGTVQEIFHQPQHPYTLGLLACRPRLDQQLRFLPTVSDFMDVSQDPSTGEFRLQPKVESPDIIEVSVAEQEQRLLALSSQTPLLRVENLQVFFPVKGVLGRTQRYVTAVNDVSFQVYPGETLGLVGESGCGKTTLGRAILRLIHSNSGQIWFDGVNINRLRQGRLRRLRRDLQFIFQDPYGALDPRMSVEASIMEPLHLHEGRLSQQQLQHRVAELLERVGLRADMAKRYPHEFSGGQRQRICIARALALKPRLIICDESVSALDVSVQAQVLNLLKELQSEFNLTYIFISHDLSVVKFMSDRIMVMNRGKIEEIGSAATIYERSQSAYTQQLIAAIPAG
jgi:peptide/nickel transport system ATP-binding protein